MKCVKLTYMSPLRGSVECEDVVKQDYGKEVFGSEGVYALFYRTYEVDEFLSNCIEDLVQCVPNSLKNLVVKAVFGKHEIHDKCLFLITEIFVRHYPTQEQLDNIQDWITGQLSDGWGESLEQRAVYEEEVTVDTVEFNPCECEFEHDSYDTTAYYYLHPWSYEDWSLEMVNDEEVEVDIPYAKPKAFGANCRLNDSGEYTSKTVYKIADGESAVHWIKESGACYDSDMFRLIEEKGSLADPVEIFVIHSNTGLFSQFLPVVGMMNSTKARLFQIDEESGEIDLQDYDNEQFNGFYAKLLMLAQ